jgi:hypothetical protein
MLVKPPVGGFTFSALTHDDLSHNWAYFDEAYRFIVAIAEVRIDRVTLNPSSQTMYPEY